jgi:hypothetical protein
VASAQATDPRGPLHLISACSNHNGGYTFPAILYRFDENRGELQTVRTLVPDTEGTDAVLYDDDLRLWVACHPKLKSNRFAVVNYDRPEQERVLRFEYDTKSRVFLSARLLRKPEPSIPLCSKPLIGFTFVADGFVR